MILRPVPDQLGRLMWSILASNSQRLGHAFVSKNRVAAPQPSTASDVHRMPLFRPMAGSRRLAETSGTVSPSMKSHSSAVPY